MEKNSKLKSRVASLIAQLADEKITEIDFDRLAACMSETLDLLDEFEREQTELSVLREDYIDRISGMRKAIAAVSRSQNELEGMLEYLDGLSELTPTELIKQYRVTSARFRDCFPASYGQLRASRSAPAAGQDLSVYK